MSKQGSFFDYMFYRIAKAYYKFDGGSAITAIVLIGGLPVFWILWILLFINKFIFVDFLPVKGFSQTIAILIVLGCLISWLRYKGKYNEFKERWINEPSNLKTIKGFLIVGIMASTFLSFFFF